MYEKVPLTLTGPQLRKLRMGHTVQLSNNALSPQSAKHSMYLHPLTAQKIRTSLKKGAGCRICATNHEVDMSGEGLADIWNWVKTNVPKAAAWAYENVPKAAKYVKENVIDTPLYQENVKPRARAFLDSKLESMPYSTYTEPIAHYVGDKTGAFGVKKGRKPPMKKAKKQIGGSFRV